MCRRVLRVSPQPLQCRWIMWWVKRISTGPINISIPLSTDIMGETHIIQYHSVGFSTFISIFRDFVKLHHPSSNNICSRYTRLSISMFASFFYHPLVILVRPMTFSPRAYSSRHFPASFSPARLLLNIMVYLYRGLITNF